MASSLKTATFFVRGDLLLKVQTSLKWAAVHFLFRVLQLKPLDLFESNFAHTFLLVLPTGGEKCAIDIQSVSLNYSANFNENGPKNRNCYF